MTLNRIDENSVDDVVLNGVLKAIDDKVEWLGTMSALQNILNSIYRRSQRRIGMLPASPSALRVVMNRITNRLRTRGISVKFGRTTDHSRTRYVRFAR